MEIVKTSGAFKRMIKTVAPALKALVANLIDYAGLYPPAKVPLPAAIDRYNSYRNCEHAWMLRWFVVGQADLEGVPNSLNGCLSILSETDQPRAAALETTSIVVADKPVYCEVAFNDLEQLEKIKQSPCFAKMRTGGVKPEAIPAPSTVASFILKCAELRLPFKATAGLHHPVRKEYPLTYEADAPCSTMHGFLNVLMASALAWKGEKDIEAVLEESDPGAFAFDKTARWRDKTLTVDEISDARKNFMHAIGSCSFEEPVHDLKTLGLL